MKKERIGLFGGTFNPIHSGHIWAAEVVQKKFILDWIFFIPSYIPPHKKSTEIASPFHRLKMVELALCLHPQFIPSSIEVDAKERSYSIITLKKIKRINPDAWIFFILGIDSFLEINTWKDYEQLLEQCSFIVISRPGYRLNDAKNFLNHKYKGRILELSKTKEVNDEMFNSYKIFLFPLNALDIASTDIREKIKKGDSIEGLVSDEVKSYIEDNNLYQTECHD